MSVASPDIIKDGDWVILDENNERRSFARIQASKQVRVGKSSIPCDTVIGQPYGSIFELSADRKSATRLHRPPDQEAEVRDVDTSKNNSQLCDENKRNQQLTKEEIEAMKAAGKGGDEIIQALISKSATFQTKTEFSQEKYKKKKAKKYCAYVTVRRTTSSSICQTFFQKEALRVGNLRPDTLAIMLSHANVCAHQQVLVVETLCGIIITSVVERMGGHGRVCALHTNKAAPLDALQYGNFDAAHRGVLLTTGLPDILAAQTEGPPQANGADQPAAAPASARKESPENINTVELPPEMSTAPENQTELLVASTAEEATTETTASLPNTAQPGGDEKASSTAMDTDDPAKEPPAANMQGGDADAGRAEIAVDTSGEAGATGKDSRPAQGPKQFKSHSASEAEVKEMAEKGFDSAILACPQVQPLALLDSVWPLLRPSASFVIFSPGMQPLAECMQALHERKAAVMLQLQESWMRQHQVLPGRTHPEMMTTGTGGYILSGVKVVMASTVKKSQPAAKQLTKPAAGAAKKAMGKVVAFTQDRKKDSATDGADTNAASKGVQNKPLVVNEDGKEPQSQGLKRKLVEDESMPDGSDKKQQKVV